MKYIPAAIFSILSAFLLYLGVINADGDIIIISLTCGCTSVIFTIQAASLGSKRMKK